MSAAAPEISVIMRVYNAGRFLEPAAASVLAQTFSDLELLLVDDGSTDGSAALCDAIAAKDARVRVIHKPNGGPATASNAGVDAARGRYIGFVDSDDLAAPALYERLHAALTAAGTPLAACSGDAIDEAGALMPGLEVTCRAAEAAGAAVTLDTDTLFLEAFQTGSFYGPLSWNKLFEKRLFTEKHIRYDETMLYGDDASVLHLLFAGERIACLPDRLYHYRQRAGSITAGTFSPRKLDDLRMYWQWLCYFRTRGADCALYQWALARYWQIFYLFWCLAGAAGNQKALKPQFMEHKKHLDSVLPALLRCPHVAAAEKARAVLFAISPSLTYTLASAKGKLFGRT